MERKSFYGVVLSFQRQALCLLNHLMVHDSKDSNDRYPCLRSRTPHTNTHSIVLIHSALNLALAMPMFCWTRQRAFTLYVFFAFYYILFPPPPLSLSLSLSFSLVVVGIASVIQVCMRIRSDFDFQMKSVLFLREIRSEWVSEWLYKYASVCVCRSCIQQWVSVSVNAGARARCVHVLRLLCVNVLNKRPYFPHTT